MTLRDRLRSLGGHSAPAPQPAAEESAEGTLTPALSQREREQNTPPFRPPLPLGEGRGEGRPALAQPRTPRWLRPIESVVPGLYQETADGPCFVSEQRYPISQAHGRLTLDRFLGLLPQVAVFWCRDDSLYGLDPRRAVFLDLETTGLAGGTGTYAFLVGLGQVEGDEFMVRQYFLRELGEERPLLEAVTEALSGAGALVTFNGKCFDWPLLETRYLYSRMRPPLSDPLHLDLLYPSRRLWRHRLNSCALGSLEKHVLGLEREGDVPGWLIPTLYFQYLTERDARPLRPVFQHNCMDILSMAALAGLFGQLGPAQASLDLLVGADHYGLGRALEDAGYLEKSVLSYEQALQHELTSEQQGHTLSRLSLVYKRLRQSEQAVEIWQRLAAGPDPAALWPCIELAKHYEHQARDYRRAEELTLRALISLELRRDLGSQGRVREELRHRLRRLKVKQAGELSRGMEETRLPSP